MEYAYSNQAKAKSDIQVDDFIMFAERDDSVLDSGTVIARNGNRITVLFDNDGRADDIIEFDLSQITIYRDKDWPDNAVDTLETEEIKTRRLNVTVACQAVYNSSIEVPFELSFEEAIEFAKEHIREIPLGALEYIPDSDELDVENCDFDDLDLEEDLENVSGQAKKSSLDQQIQSASTRTAESHPFDKSMAEESTPER